MGEYEPYCRTVNIRDEITVRLLKLISNEGAQGKIWLAEDVGFKKQYVLKETTCRTEEQVAIAKKEVDFLKSMKNKYIVKYINAGKTVKKNEDGDVVKTVVYLLIEKCQDDLLRVLNSLDKNRLSPGRYIDFSERDILAVFKQICQGVEAMHTLDPPVAHRDLKLENILIYSYNRDDNNMVIRICDFGSSVNYSTKLETKKERLLEAERVEKYTTPKYRAPELYNLFEGTLINEKVDIWSLGCMLYSLAYKTFPFDEAEKLAILNAQYELPKFPAYSSKFSKLIQWMLNPDPALRPQIGDVYDYVCEILEKNPNKTAEERKSGTGKRPETEEEKEKRLKKEKQEIKAKVTKKRQKAAAKKNISALDRQRADIKARLARRKAQQSASTVA